jgi:hypothetical protein
MTGSFRLNFISSLNRRGLPTSLQWAQVVGVTRRFMRINGDDACISK